MASAQVFDSLLVLLITSVLPSLNLRVYALSYVTPGRLNILWKASCLMSWAPASGENLCFFKRFFPNPS